MSKYWPNTKLERFFPTPGGDTFVQNSICYKKLDSKFFIKMHRLWLIDQELNSNGVEETLFSGETLLLGKTRFSGETLFSGETDFLGETLFSGKATTAAEIILIYREKISFIYSFHCTFLIILIPSWSGSSISGILLCLVPGFHCPCGMQS